ncbi:MAG: SDR family oxidoreductase [Bacteroidetes bacterium]|nr:SDR family oxidoreductase [Bacteroidota bacterium]
MNKNIFQNKVIIITGASSGIGRELAIQLAEYNVSVVLVARNKEKLDEIVLLCKQKGSKAIAIKTDITDEEQCKNMIDSTIIKFGKIDILINNAGITMWAYFEEIKDFSISKKMMDVNYYGPLYCTKYALPYLKNVKGRIVNISSITGKTGVPTRSFYSASKHALNGFFDSLRIEIASSGVTITMIYPGFVSSGIHLRALGPDGKSIGKNLLDYSKVMTPQKCARLIIKATAKRKRELVMTLKGKIGLLLKFILPNFVDKLAKKAIEKGK